MNEMSSDKSAWTVAQLREELRSRGAKLSGRKKELVERLECYERNFNFGNSGNGEVEEYNISLPENALYRDLHLGCNFPKVSQHNLDDYLNGLNKSLGKDSIDLVNDRFLLFIKYAEKEDSFFVKSQCRASMKRHVLYNVDVIFQCDGVIEECQCDCGAGMGPDAHCKHVNALLYAIMKFGQNGEVLTEVTCTQKLQTFHHCKTYRGSPMKSSSLEKIVEGKRSVRFDPRPNALKGTQGYQSHFRNVCLNFPNSGDMPIVQLYPPANTYALVNDHDYCGDPEKIFLKSINVTCVTESDIEEIEDSTKKQSKCNFWKEIRCTRLNSSNFGRICKATDRTNHHELAKTLTVHNKISSKAIRHGIKYESVAIKAYSEQTGNNVTRCGSFVSITHPFLAASPDGIVSDDVILEVKCPYTAKGKNISHATVPFLHDCKGNLTLKVPGDSFKAHNYYYQVQGQLFCTGKKYCDFVVYTIKDIKIIRIQRDQQFIDQMIEKLQCFFDSHFRSAVLDKYFYRNYNKYTFDY